LESGDSNYDADVDSLSVTGSSTTNHQELLHVQVIDFNIGGFIFEKSTHILLLKGKQIFSE